MAALLVGLVVLVLLYVPTKGASSSGKAAIGQSELAPVESEVGGDLSNLKPPQQQELDGLMVEAAEGIRRLREGVGGLVDLRPPGTICDWGDVGRARVDASPFKQIIQSGNPQDLARLIARHPLLNVLDVPLCPNEWKDLGQLVGSAHADTVKLYTAWRQARVRDNGNAIDQGLVVPWTAPPLTESDFANHARSLMRKAQREGVVLEFQDALAEAKANPAAVAPSVGQGHIRRGNKIYLHTSFVSWPTAEPMWDQVRFLAIEELSLYVAWMQSRGRVVDMQGVIEVVSAAGSMTMGEFFRTSSK